MFSVIQANEINYALHSLGWKAFQNLCSTIMSEIWGQNIQTFLIPKTTGGMEHIVPTKVLNFSGACFFQSLIVFNAVELAVLRSAVRPCLIVVTSEKCHCSIRFYLQILTIVVYVSAARLGQYSIQALMKLGQ